MAKFLLFVVVIAAIYFIVRASGRKGAPKVSRPDHSAPLEMVSCARCGVNFPRSEALFRDGREYCSEEHRQLGAGS